MGVRSLAVLRASSTAKPGVTNSGVSMLYIIGIANVLESSVRLISKIERVGVIAVEVCVFEAQLLEEPLRLLPVTFAAGRVRRRLPLERHAIGK